MKNELKNSNHRVKSTTLLYMFAKTGLISRTTDYAGIQYVPYNIFEFYTTHFTCETDLHRVSQSANSSKIIQLYITLCWLL